MRDVHCQRSQGHLVYVARSSTGQAIYVGQTGDWPKRLRRHMSSSAWMSDVAYFETESCADKRQAVWLEGVLIRALTPRENIQGRAAGLLAFRQSFVEAEAS